MPLSRTRPVNLVSGQRPVTIIRTTTHNPTTAPDNNSYTTSYPTTFHSQQQHLTTSTKMTTKLQRISARPHSMSHTPLPVPPWTETSHRNSVTLALNL